MESAFKDTGDSVEDVLHSDFGGKVFFVLTP